MGWRTLMIVIAFDPGKTGGWSWYRSDTNAFTCGGFKNGFDWHRDSPSNLKVKVFIEQQTVTAGQSGAGKSLMEVGKIIGYFQALGVEDVTLISPQKWYRYHKIPAGMNVKDRKQFTCNLMEKRHPDLKSYFYGPKGALLDGVTDSLAILDYAISTIPELVFV